MGMKMKIRNLVISFFVAGSLLFSISSFALSPATNCPKELSETKVVKDPILMDKNHIWKLLDGVNIPEKKIQSSGFIFFYDKDPKQVKRKAEKLIQKLIFDKQESTTGACYYVDPNDPEKTKVRAAYLLMN